MFRKFFGFDKAEPDNWTLATANIEGNEAIIRIRELIPSWCVPEIYKHLIMISWPFDGMNGMPDKVTNKTQQDMENVIEKKIESTKNCILTVVVTCGGVKEWQIYSKDIDVFIKLVNSNFPKEKPYPINLEMQEDLKWEAYNNFKH